MLLTKSGPWEKTPNCRQSNVTYKSTCRLCFNEGVQAAYIGETSHSLHKRIQEHTEDSIKKHEGSHIATHMIENHPEEWKASTLDNTCWKLYKLEIVKVHKLSFICQLHKAVSIMLQPGVTLC